MLIDFEQFIPKQEGESPTPSSSIIPEAIWQIESGSKQYNADNTVVTSPVGALGIGQIMPTTGPEAAKLAGVAWNPWSLAYDEDYNKTLSTAYLKQKQKDFGGDELKGVAAYNAGTGGVQKAMARAEKEGGSWRDYVPDETKNYIIKYELARRNIGPAKQSNLIDFEQFIPKQEPKSTLIDFEQFIPKQDSQTPLETFGSQAVANLIPSGVGLATGSAAAALVAPVAVASGPGAPFVEVGAFLIGMFGGAEATRRIQDEFLPQNVKNYLAAGYKENPKSAVAGSLASFAPYTKLGLPTKMLATGEIVVDKATTAALGVVGGVIDAGVQYFQKGEVDPAQVAMNVVATPFIGGRGLSKAGKIISGKPVVPDSIEQQVLAQDELITQNTWRAQNSIDLSAAHARQYEILLREEVLKNMPKDRATPELEKDTFAEIASSLGRNSKGGKARSIIMADADVPAFRRNMQTAWDKHELNIRGLRETLKLNLREQDRLQFETVLEKRLRSQENIKYILEKKERFGSTEYLLPILEKVRNSYDELGIVARDAGVIDGMLNNYVPLLVDKSQSKLSDEGLAQALEGFFKLKQESFKTDSSKERMFNTANDLQDYLNTIDPKLFVHRDIATITSAYMTSMNKAIAQKGLIDDLKGTTIIGTRNPVISTDADFAMRNKYVAYNSRGSSQLEGSFVHPDYAPILDHMFQRNDIGAIKNAMLQTAMLTKALNVAGSLFHAPSLGWAMAGASPKLAFKEIITGGSGIRKAVRDLKNGEMSEYTELAIKSGTKIGTEDVQRSIVADFGAYVDKKMFGGTKVVGQVTAPIDRFILQKMNTFTWDYMHTGGKLVLFKDLMMKSERNLKEVPGTPEYTTARFELAERISNSVNHTMGGLQWLQAAASIKNKVNRQLAIHGSGIESRAWAQVALFAPDWTVSTLGSFLKGMPDKINPTKWDVKAGIKGIVKPMNEADLSRRYMINTGLMYLTILDAINLGTSGQHIWQNEDPTRIQHADGTTQQLAKHSMEFFHWLMDPAKTLKNKLGFFPKAALAFIDDQGGNYLERLGTVAKLAAPFSVGSAMQAPEGEATKRALMSAAGFPIYGKPLSYLRDPQDVLKEKFERREVRQENKMQKIEEIQRRAETSQLRGLFSEYL